MFSFFPLKTICIRKQTKHQLLCSPPTSRYIHSATSWSGTPAPVFVTLFQISDFQLKAIMNLDMVKIPAEVQTECQNEEESWLNVAWLSWC